MKLRTEWSRHDLQSVEKGGWNIGGSGKEPGEWHKPAHHGNPRYQCSRLPRPKPPQPTNEIHGANVATAEARAGGTGDGWRVQFRSENAATFSPPFSNPHTNTNFSLFLFQFRLRPPRPATNKVRLDIFASHQSPIHSLSKSNFEIAECLESFARFSFSFLS